MFLIPFFYLTAKGSCHASPTAVFCCLKQTLAVDRQHNNDDCHGESCDNSDRFFVVFFYFYLICVRCPDNVDIIHNSAFVNTPLNHHPTFYAF